MSRFTNQTALITGGTGGLGTFTINVTGQFLGAALELGRDNIRVNSIHPGVVNTPLITEPPHPGTTGRRLLLTGRLRHQASGRA